jgi:hypothetical protein
MVWDCSKYEAGHYFGAHIDGYYQPNKDERSFITLMVGDKYAALSHCH